MKEKTNFMGSVMKIIVCTPNRNPDINTYQSEVLPRVRKIKELNEHLAGSIPRPEEVEEILIDLRKIMQIKKVDSLEQEQRMNELLLNYPWIQNISVMS